MSQKCILGTTEVYEVCFFEGKMVGYRTFIGCGGVQKGRKISVSAISVGIMQNPHCNNRDRILANDIVRVEKEAKRQVADRIVWAAGFYLSTGVGNCLVEFMSDLAATGQTIDDLDLSSSWEKLPAEEKLEAIKKAIQPTRKAG